MLWEVCQAHFYKIEIKFFAKLASIYLSIYLIKVKWKNYIAFAQVFPGVWGLTVNTRYCLPPSTRHNAESITELLFFIYLTWTLNYTTQFNLFFIDFWYNRQCWVFAWFFMKFFPSQHSLNKLQAPRWKFGKKFIRNR